jgi:antitoxin HicB
MMTSNQIQDQALGPSRPIAPEIIRQVERLMARPYRKVITGDAADGFLAMAPELPGCVTAGETEAEALELLHDAMSLWMTSALEDGQPVPEPAGQSSGRMLLRMPGSLHRRLLERAEVEGVSANQLAVTLLAKGL